MLKNVSSAAVLIGALKVKSCFQINFFNRNIHFVNPDYEYNATILTFSSFLAALLLHVKATFPPSTL